MQSLSTLCPTEKALRRHLLPVAVLKSKIKICAWLVWKQKEDFFFLFFCFQLRLPGCATVHPLQAVGPRWGWGQCRGPCHGDMSPSSVTRQRGVSTQLE